MDRLLFAAPQSSSGKTSVVATFLRVLQRRGIAPSAFKCGPDYLDPMFHRRVLDLPSHNLDLFLSDEATVRSLLCGHAQSCDFAVIEGVMGYYDGVGGSTDRASSWQLATVTETPAVLVVTPQGGSLTLAAQLQGLMSFRTPSRISAVLLNRCKPTQYKLYKELLEQNLNLPVVGYLPPMEELCFGQRHLGLVQAGEVDDYNRRLDAAAQQMEESVNIDALLRIAATAEPITAAPLPKHTTSVTTIAVAMDEAFSFYYDDNLDLLRRCGAQLLPFSPLHDTALPDGACGLYLGGGYPELHAAELAGNLPMREAIRTAVMGGMPTIAECGGFLYLGQTLEDSGSKPWPMVGVLPGSGLKTGRLQRFGYLTLQAKADSLLFRQGEAIPAHEFHYWDSTDNGTALSAAKPTGDRRWECGFATYSLYAGFPHLYFYANPLLAERFVAAAATYKQKGL